MEPSRDFESAPDAYLVELDSFEGPLDLLIHLIKKNEVNIYDIPISLITQEYLRYVELLEELDLDAAGEFLVMAATLMEIKSRMLLPPKKSAEGQEPEDPRAELVRRLLEYERIKLAAARLDALPVLGRDFLRAEITIEQSLKPRFPDVHAGDLRTAWADIVRRARLHQHHKITREQLSVREHMSLVIRRLQGRRFLEFGDLFETTRGVPVVVVTFIALLELSRESLVEVTQAEAFAPIYVRLAFTPS